MFKREGDRGRQRETEDKKKEKGEDKKWMKLVNMT